MKTCGDGFCGECGESCEVYAEEISWDYAGTHCTHGKAGTHHAGVDYRSVCCDATAYVDDDLSIEFDNDDCQQDYDGPDTWDEYWGVR